MSASDFLVVTLNMFGLPTSGARVLDCCAGDGSLAFSLSSNFGQVSSNDIDTKLRTQTHYDVRRSDFWQGIHAAYEFIVTKPPADLVETIVTQSAEHCPTVALLLSAEKLAQSQPLFSHKPVTAIITVGSQQSWCIWSQHLPYKGLLIEFTDTDVELRARLNADEFISHAKERIQFCFSKSFHPNQTHQFMQPHQFYSPQFSSGVQANGYPAGSFGFSADPSMDQYTQLQANHQYAFKRDPSINGYIDQTKRSESAGALAGPGIFSDIVMPTSLSPLTGAGASVYPQRHNVPAAYNQNMMPYSHRSHQQPSPPPQWPQFQQQWAGQTNPTFSAAHMASGLSPAGTHVAQNNPYSAIVPAGTSFNPAAILMDMDKLTQTGNGRSTGSPEPPFNAPNLSSSPGSISYGLHKPTAFKVSGGTTAPSSTSPGPSAGLVAASLDDSNMMLSQAEMLYLKGVHAAKQGKALEVAIDKYRSSLSKKDVITKVCKMKYRSAQRKLRIAKHIQRFPEISTMTQRQAERYISEKLKKTRTQGESGSASPSREESN